MTRLFIGIVLIVALIFAATHLFQDGSSIKSGFIQGDKRQAVEIEEELIFVPYWTLSSGDDLSIYDTLIYFGIAADENGIKEDPGSENVDAFLAKAHPGQKKLLTLRMVDHDTNGKILENKNTQQRIVSDTISFAKDNGFDGIVVDFETKSLGFEEITQKTTDFLTRSAKKIQDSGLEAHTLLFGDTYYRARAFDVARIAKASDSIMVMAYDFHKSGGGVPGPTFPTYGRDKYGYDFVTMLEDFAGDAKSGKTTIILGMFGYSWDEDGAATSLTTKEAQNTMLTNCRKKSCSVTIDPESREARVMYTEDGVGREAWVETHGSKDIKIDTLKNNGISKVGYWAHSFF